MFAIRMYMHALYRTRLIVGKVKLKIEENKENREEKKIEIESLK